MAKWYVGKTGRDIAGNGTSPDTPFQTLGFAYYSAAAGDEIVFKSGETWTCNNLFASSTCTKTSQTRWSNASIADGSVYAGKLLYVQDLGTQLIASYRISGGGAGYVDLTDQLGPGGYAPACEICEPGILPKTYFCGHSVMTSTKRCLINLTDFVVDGSGSSKEGVYIGSLSTLMLVGGKFSNFAGSTSGLAVGSSYGWIDGVYFDACNNGLAVPNSTHGMFITNCIAKNCTTGFTSLATSGGNTYVGCTAYTEGGFVGKGWNVYNSSLVDCLGFGLDVGLYVNAANSVWDVTNCTFTKNNYGIKLDSTANGIKMFYNNIIWGNNTSDFTQAGAIQVLCFRNNCLGGKTLATNLYTETDSFTDDPKFVNAAGWNFKLSKQSPYLNKSLVGKFLAGNAGSLGAFQPRCPEELLNVRRASRLGLMEQLMGMQ